MKGDTRLYIDGRKVDFTGNPNIFYNWQLTDFQNPTAVKNSFSKTITLNGTKNNNKIFGDIWKLDRQQGYGGNSGVNYNATYRCPFQLYLGDSADLFEEGYVKLQKVKILENGNYQYEIGLFGTLGLFLYNLQTDWNTGNKRTLGDLNYYIEDIPLFDSASTFVIDKDTIKEAWNEIDLYSSKWSVINFAPTYSGYNDKMDTEKALINFSGQTFYQETNTHTDDDNNTTTYTSYQGYALATLPRKLVEAEAGDYRSWCQQPVIKCSAVIDAICRKENNRGKYDDGFEVELDSEFFNSRNPYLDSWMTLPRIQTLNIKTNGDSESAYTANYVTGYTYDVDGVELVYALDAPVAKFGTTAELNFDLLINAASAGTTSDWDNLYPSAYIRVSGDNMKFTNVYAIQGLASTDSIKDSAPIDGTKVLWCEYNRDESHNKTLPYTFEQAHSLVKQDIKKGMTDSYSPRYETSSSVLDEGHFVRYNNKIYRWNHQLSLSIPLPIGSTHFRIRIDRRKNTTHQKAGNIRSWLVNSTDFIGNSTNHLVRGAAMSMANVVSNRTFRIKTGDVSNFYSGQELKFKDLLNTSFSPADFLLDFCKMFGLYIRKDKYENKIYIETRNTFFQRDDITDISKNIAFDKGIEISPTLLEAKYYDMQTKYDEGGCYKDYKNKYGKEYGEKIINSGWEFDADVKQLISSNFKGAVQTCADGIYYFEPFTDGVRAFAFDGLVYTLYKDGDYTSDETNDMTLGRQSILDVLEPYQPNLPYFDIVDRAEMCNNEKKPLDGSYVLLFHQGDDDVSRAKYYLTDDLGVMQKLINKPCYIITGCEYDKQGNHIAYKLDTMPHFSRYWTSTNYFGSGSTRNNILYSLDFGSPRQLYLPNYINYEESNLYSQFYQAYYSDMYDVNTRQVTLYWKPNEILSGEHLRRLYFFANCLWRLNRIIDYNPSEKGLVKCEFVKVNDVNSLTNSIPSKELSIIVTLDRYTIDGNGGTIIGSVSTSDHGPWSIEGWDYDDEITISPLTGATDGTFTISVPSYYNTINRSVTIRVSAGDLTANVTFVQTPIAVQESVSISAATPIAATATTLGYGVVSVPSARVDLKSGSTILFTQNVTGTTSGLFNITANTSQSSRTYTLYAETPNGYNDTCQVVQNGASTPPTPPTPPTDYYIDWGTITLDKQHSDIDGWTLPDGSVEVYNGASLLGDAEIYGDESNLILQGLSFTGNNLNAVSIIFDFSQMSWNTSLHPDICIDITLNNDEQVTLTYSMDGLTGGFGSVDISQYAHGDSLTLDFTISVRANN